LFGIHDYPLFLLASLSLHAVPGQDVMFVLARSLGSGRASGLLAALGIGMGSFVYAILFALGLASLLAAHPGVVDTIRMLGALYVAFLGISQLRKVRRSDRVTLVFANEVPTRARRSFRDGLITNLSNAKVMVFYAAFLPQFVQGSPQHIAMGIFLLGLSFSVTGTIWNAGIAWLAGQAAAIVQNSVRIAVAVDVISGALLVMIAILMLSRG
jgi:threonine/homoserine/homoserine lactone efflux protein